MTRIQSLRTLKPILMLALVVSTLSPSIVWADASAILSCRQIADPARRFACYEAIDVSASASSAQATPVKPPQPSPESFGLEQRSAQSQLQSIDSTIAGRFYGWDPNERIALTNGQVWQIVDDSRGALVSTDPKVKVRRGALGAFYLEIEGTNRSPKVRRVK